MSMDLQISSESGCLRVKATGKFSLAEAKRTFLEVVKAVEEHGVGKVLFDGRGLKGKPETMERFYYGAFAAEEVAEYAVRNRCVSPEFAYVLHVPTLDPCRFGETVAVNRGMRVKAFGDLEGARAWLGRGADGAPNEGGGRKTVLNREWTGTRVNSD